MPEVVRSGADASSVAVVPRDDRAWPRGSLTVSLVGIAVAVAAGAWLAIATGDEGPVVAVAVAGVFAGAFAYAVAVAVPMMRRWVAGHRMPARLRLIQAAGFVAGFAILAFAGAGFGWAAIAGMIGGTLAANAGAIRAAQANRGLVDRAEADDASRAATRGATRDAVRQAPARRAAVGGVLREVLAAERRRAAAWVVAAGIAVAGCLLLQAPDVATVVVGAVGGVASAWVLRRWVGAWMALRSFSTSVVPPRRAFVVLLHDPAPRIIRPLLGVWSTAPALQQGRLPRPEHVYRCDEELDGLVSYQGAAVVHEAWVDAGGRSGARPRWVAADAGVVLPHRRAWFGRWYLGRLLWGERPGRPEPLTLRQPTPADEGPLGPLPRRSFVVAVAGRVAALGVIALVLAWLG